MKYALLPDGENDTITKVQPADIKSFRSRYKQQIWLEADSIAELLLLNDIKAIIRAPAQQGPLKPQGYKTAEVRKMQGCCVNKLVSLRISRKLSTKKIWSTLYYNRDDVKRLPEEGF